MVLDQFKSSALARRTDDLATAAIASVSHLERILINCLVNQNEVASELMPLLAQLDGWRKLPSGPLLDAMLRAWQNGEELRFSTIEPRLDAADKDLLSQMLLDEEVYRESQTRDQAIACLQKLDLIQIADFRRDLKRRVREAELKGDLDEAMRLSEQLRQIDAQRLGHPT